MKPPTAADPLALTIEKVVYGGEGLSRTAEHGVVLTPYVLPGEEWRVALEAGRGTPRRAKPMELVTASPQRVEPACPYFGDCGGCQLQQASVPYQVELKLAMLRETLQRIGKVEAPGEIGILSGDPWHYRNRTQFHLKDGEIGFMAAGSQRLIPVDRCPISAPKINETLATLREMHRNRRFPDFIGQIELFTDGSSIQLNALETTKPVAKSFFDWCAEQIPGLVPGALEYEAAGYRFAVSYQSFFQTNRFLVDALVDSVVGEATGKLAIDLYSGVGLFSLPLSKRFERVVAVESNGHAAADLRGTAARYSAEIQVVKGGVDTFLQSWTERPDLVVADPPRAGLGQIVTEGLLRLRPQELVLVSCDPSSLARDLALLIGGGYRIANLQLADLFPQTYHLETVCRLQLAE